MQPSLWIYDFPRFSKIHCKSSKLYAFRQLPCTHPWEFWVAEASWKCIILSAHHQCPGETRDERKGQQVAGENSTVSASMSWWVVCVVSLPLDGRLNTGPGPPSGTKNLKAHLEKLHFWGGRWASKLFATEILEIWGRQCLNLLHQCHVILEENGCQNIMLLSKNRSLLYQILASLRRRKAQVL